ncbi:hypothetical protein HDU96_005145 [Phlyctochytrium bullatum]|nr:hypothetical protein HDU96_005145 [Phlyctochytrium bullatum]
MEFHMSMFMGADIANALLDVHGLKVTQGVDRMKTHPGFAAYCRFRRAWARRAEWGRPVGVRGVDEAVRRKVGAEAARTPARKQPVRGATKGAGMTPAKTPAKAPTKTPAKSAMKKEKGAGTPAAAPARKRASTTPPAPPPEPPKPPGARADEAAKLWGEEMPELRDVYAKKAYLKCGLYADELKGKETAKKEGGKFKMEMPMFYGEMMMETETDFELPFDVVKFVELRCGSGYIPQVTTNAKRKPSPFVRLKKSG